METLEKIAKERAEELYGGKFPNLVEKRLEAEIQTIKDDDTGVFFKVAYDLKKRAQKKGALLYFRNAYGSPLFSYLLDIVTINPLPGHYICPNHDYVEFPEVDDGYVWCGPDLPDKKCPICGKELEKYGYSFHEKLYPQIWKDTDYQLIAECTDRFITECMPGDFKELDEAEAKEKGLYVPGEDMGDSMERALYEVEKKMIKKSGQDKPQMDRKYFHVLKKDRDIRLTCVLYPNLEFLERLETATNIKSNTIPFGDQKTYTLFHDTSAIGVSKERIYFSLGTLGVPAYGSHEARKMLQFIKPTKYSQMIQCIGAIISAGTWYDNADKLMREDNIPLSEIITMRDDIFIKLLSYNMDETSAAAIAMTIGSGNGVGHDAERVMEAMDIPEWYIESCRKIKYLFPKSYVVYQSGVLWRIAWYKSHYPKEFYKCFIDNYAGGELKEKLLAGANVVREAIDEYDPEVLGDLGRGTLTEYPIYMVANEMYARGYHYYE